MIFNSLFFLGEMLPLFFAIYRSVRWVRKRQSKLRRHTFRYWYHVIDKLKFSIIILFRLFLKPLLVKQLCKSLFLRFVAEINLPLLFSSRETSLAARSKEKRLYSQATFLHEGSESRVSGGKFSCPTNKTACSVLLRFRIRN